MVAIQQVEYDSKGQIVPPRKELLSLWREPNGEFSSKADHWHRHTLAADSERSFQSALTKLKAELARVGAEVLQIERSGATVVDIFYLVEDRSRTKRVLREVSRGQCPPTLALNDLTPSR